MEKDLNNLFSFSAMYSMDDVKIQNLIVINNIFSFFMVVCLFYLCMSSNKLYDYLLQIPVTTLTDYKKFNIELKRLQAKSLDIADTNIILSKKSQDMENEISKLKYDKLKSGSHDSYFN